MAALYDITHDGFSDNVVFSVSGWSAIGGSTSWKYYNPFGGGGNGVIYASDPGGEGLIIYDAGSTQVSVDGYFQNWDYSYVAGPVARCSDASNYIRAVVDDNTNALRLYVVVGGTETERGSYSFSPANNTVYKVTLVCDGNDVEVFLDDVSRITYTLAVGGEQGLSGTNVGNYAEQYSFIHRMAAETLAAATTVPDAVDDLAGAPGDTEVVLTWTAPSDGGASITDYEYRVDGGTWTSTSSASPGFTVTSLTNGVEYDFEVRAINSEGSADASNLVSYTPAAAVTVPDAVDDLNGTPGDTQVVLSWTAPDDGGDAITSYDYRVDGGSWTTTGSSSPGFTVTSLTNDTEYDFEVRAVNGEGNSAASNLVSVTPFALLVFPYSDDFEDLTDADDYDVVRGATVDFATITTDWEVNDDGPQNIIFSTGGAGVATLDAGDKLRHRGEAQFKAQTSSLGGPVVLYLNSNNLVLLEMVFIGGEDAVKLYKRIGGTWTEIATTGNTMGFVSGTYYDFRLDLRGLNLFGYVDRGDGWEQVVTGSISSGELSSLGTEVGVWTETTLNVGSFSTGRVPPGVTLGNTDPIATFIGSTEVASVTITP